MYKLLTLSLVLISAWVLGSQVDDDGAFVLSAGAFVYAQGGGTTYYVDADGDDSNNGTSTSTPFATVLKARNSVSSGDTILINRGDTFAGNLVYIFNDKNNLTIGAYGTGDKPILDNLWNIPTPKTGGGYNGVLQFNGGSGIDVSNVHIRNSGGMCIRGLRVTNAVVDSVDCYRMYRSGIQFRESSGILASNNTIDVTNEGARLYGEPTWGQALTVQETDDIVFLDNTITNSWGESIGIITGTSNARVHGNRIHASRRLAIYIDSSTDVEIDDNLVTGAPASSPYYTTASDCITFNNESYQFADHNSNGPKLSDDKEYNDVIIRGNYCGGTAVGLAIFNQHRNLDSTKIRIYHNSFIDNGLALNRANTRFGGNENVIANNAFVWFTSGHGVGVSPLDDPDMDWESNYWTAAPHSSMRDGDDVYGGATVAKTSGWRNIQNVGDITRADFALATGSVLSGAATVPYANVVAPSDSAGDDIGAVQDDVSSGGGGGTGTGSTFSQTIFGRGANASTSDTTNSGDGWATPTSGNVLVGCIATRNYSTDTFTFTVPSGFTLIDELEPDGTSTLQVSGACFAKISDGSESAVTFAISATADNGFTTMLTELPSTGLDTSSIGALIGNNAKDTSKFKTSTTTIATGSAANVLENSTAVAVFMCGQYQDCDASGYTYSNTFTERAEGDSSNGFSPGIRLATYNTMDAASRSSTFTASETIESGLGMIFILEGNAGSADSTPDAITFADRTTSLRGDKVRSEWVAIEGLENSSTLNFSSTGDTGHGYEWTNDFQTTVSTASSGTYVSGSTFVRAFVTSSGSNSTGTTATVTVNTVSDAFTVTTSAAITAIAQDSGSDKLASIEAEDCQYKPAVGGYTWTDTTSPATGFSGTGSVTLSPTGAPTISDGFSGSSPSIECTFTFVASGAHYLFVRGLATTGDTFHAGINGGEEVKNASIAIGDSYAWSTGQEITVPSTGTHTVSIYHREDALALDKVVLSTNSAYDPSGVATLSLPTGTATGKNTATATVTTSDATGTLYLYTLRGDRTAEGVAPETPGIAELQAGTNAAYSSSKTITSSGLHTFSSVSGLIAGVEYFNYFVKCSTVCSPVSVSEGFTTTAGTPGITAVLRDTDSGAAESSSSLTYSLRGEAHDGSVMESGVLTTDSNGRFQIETSEGIEINDVCYLTIQNDEETTQALYKVSVEDLDLL